jgi:hypothetical protein
MSVGVKLPHDEEGARFGLGAQFSEVQGRLLVDNFGYLVDKSCDLCL